MKTIYLVRHAKSSWKDADIQDDIHRPLNDRGKRDAPFIGKILSAKGIHPDVMVSSPAIRAFKTAKLIAEALDYPKKDILIHPEIYEAAPQTILSIIHKLQPNWNTVFLFGHNPTFTEIANWYSGAIDNLPTCGVVGIEFDIRFWEEVTITNGNIFLMEYPKKYLPGIPDED